jgi:hypothetical protein
MVRARLQIVILFLWTTLGCVDPVDLSIPSDDRSFILEGNVTDNSGPDTIRLSKSFPADGNYYNRLGIPGAKLWITDDAAVVDTLIDLGNGVYVTNNLQGAVGRTYTIAGEIPVKYPDDSKDTTRFISALERMSPAGTIDSIYYELTTKVNQETGIAEDGLNVFIDASVDASSSHRLRWKFNGTYIFVSDPSLIQIPEPCLDPVCPTIPLACASGCECCICWASEREALPLVTSPEFLGGTKVNRVFVKYIPINGFTFYDRYHVEVTQMELSKPVFDFYSGIRKQMENASSLFQPPFFGLEGNVKVLSGKTKLIGVFSAAAEVKAYRYINSVELPMDVSPTILAGDCRVIVDHSTNIKPPFWN